MDIRIAVLVALPTIPMQDALRNTVPSQVAMRNSVPFQDATRNTVPIHRALATSHRSAVAVSNQFQALSEDDDGSHDEQQICLLESLELGSEKGICHIREKGDESARGQWKSLGHGEITIDSAADESCWLANLCGEFAVKASKRNLRLKAANGSDMRHDGEKNVTFLDKDFGETLGMTFQVTEVRKPLAAVWRLTEKGNVVQFGPEEHQNFVLNLRTNKKIRLHRGGSYVLKVEYMKWIPEVGSSPVFLRKA